MTLLAAESAQAQIHREMLSRADDEHVCIYCDLNIRMTAMMMMMCILVSVQGDYDGGRKVGVYVVMLYPATA
jgi:hypothetical protein